MKAIRVETDVEMVKTPGSIWKAPSGVWYCHAPGDKGYSGNLAQHEVTEHEDGTITVSPSILITNPRDGQWHGFLERGEWREV